MCIVCLCPLAGFERLYQRPQPPLNAAPDTASASFKFKCSPFCRYCGFEVTTEGDSFTIAFHDAFDAVSWALAMQQVGRKAGSQQCLHGPLGPLNFKSCALSRNAMSLGARQAACESGAVSLPVLVAGSGSVERGQSQACCKFCIHWPCEIHQIHQIHRIHRIPTGNA